MQCCVEGCNRPVMRRSKLKRCELHTIEYEKEKSREYAAQATERREAAKAAGTYKYPSHPCLCGCGQMITGRKQLAEGCKPAPAYRPKNAPKKSRPCRCGCGVTVYGAFQYASDECRDKRPRKRYRNAGHDEVQAAMKEQAAINAASKPLPRVTLSDAERDALDREKRESDLAADAALAERRRQVNADMLMARLMVGAVVPVIPTGYASPKVEYQPPQRAQTLAADRTAMWES